MRAGRSESFTSSSNWEVVAALGWKELALTVQIGYDPPGGAMCPYDLRMVIGRRADARAREA